MTCIACMSPHLKDAVLSLLEGVAAAADVRRLRNLPVCDSGADIEFEAGKKRAGGKRAPSAYNLSVKECLPRQPKSMDHTDKFKACAREWKAQKR